MKRFLKALLFTCLCVIACACGCYIIYLWIQFTSNLDVEYWMQLLICLLPGISILIVSIFLEFYKQFSKVTDSDKRCIEISGETHKLEDPKIFLDKMVQASRMQHKPKMTFVCPSGFEAAAIVYFKDTNMEVVFPGPIKAKEFYEHMKELLEKERKR